LHHQERSDAIIQVHGGDGFRKVLNSSCADLSLSDFQAQYQVAGVSDSNIKPISDRTALRGNVVEA
jgi:hypothetical protein